MKLDLTWRIGIEPARVVPNLKSWNLTRFFSRLDQVLLFLLFSRSKFESCKDRNKNDKDRSLLLFPLRAIVVRSLLNGSAWHWLTSKTVSATSFIESSRAPTLPRASSGPETGLALSLSFIPSLSLYYPPLSHALAHSLTSPDSPSHSLSNLSLSLSLSPLHCSWWRFHSLSASHLFSSNNQLGILWLLLFFLQHIFGMLNCFSGRHTFPLFSCRHETTSRLSFVTIYLQLFETCSVFCFLFQLFFWFGVFLCLAFSRSNWMRTFRAATDGFFFNFIRTLSPNLFPE